jgi:hypothetical protein
VVGCVVRFVWWLTELAVRLVVGVDQKMRWGSEKMHGTLETGYMKEAVMMRGRGCK